MSLIATKYRRVLGFKKSDQHLGGFGYSDLGLILILAFAFRLIWMIFLTGTIDTEGVEYARIAENLLAGKGYVGIVTEGQELMFPPLYPLLIAAVSLLTHQVELAARLISVVMGALLVLPVFFVTAHLYNRKAALIAAILVAVHPLLVSFSTTTFVETTYITLLFGAVYWSLQAIRTQRAPAFFCLGLLFGLAYLARPEAFLYPFLAVLYTLACVALRKREELRRVAPRSCLALIAFFVVALPYIGWLSFETGQLRLEGKSALNLAAGQQIASGMSTSEASYRVDPELTPQGIWNRTNLSVIQSTRTNVTEFPRYLFARAKHAIPQIFNAITSKPALGSPLLFGLALLGLFRRPLRPEVLVDHLFLFLVVGVITVSICSCILCWFDVHYRFLLPFLPFCIIWAAEGTLSLSHWLSETAQLAGAKPSRSLEKVTPLFMILMIVVMSAPSLDKVWEIKTFNYASRPIKLAGEWLKSYDPGPKIVMDSWTVLAFYASAAYQAFPYTDSSTALRFLDKNKVDFIVMQELDAQDVPYMREWIEKGIPDQRAKVIFSAQTQLGRTLIYRWNR